MTRKSSRNRSTELSDLPFDEETIALAGGDMQLLRNVRSLFSHMNDEELWQCLEDIKSGILSPDHLLDLMNHKDEEEPDSEPEREGIIEIHHDDGDDGDDGDNVIDGSDANNGREKDTEIEREISIDLELSNNFFNPYKFHDALFKTLRICKPDDYDDRIKNLFVCLAALCDPYTQPSSTGERNEMILSADLVTDIIIGIMYPSYEIDDNGIGVFNMGYDLGKIIIRIMNVLNADDENVLMYIKNDENNWIKELSKWIPRNTFSNIVNIASDYHHLNLLYTILTASLLIIHKLYSELGNICLNPFLSLYLQIWKNLTRIIYMGIEIDRRDEENGFPGYPEVIRYVIKGSSAVRSMISIILNDDFDRRVHDLRHESLINFMRPWGRKFTNGSINRDIRIFVAALLGLGSELDNVTELLFNFDPEDRYDEDIKYMFEMELEDMHIDEKNLNGEYNIKHKENIKKYLGMNNYLEIERHGDPSDRSDDSSGAYNENGENDSNVREINPHSNFDLHPDCECNFEDFESDYEDYEDDQEDDHAVNDAVELSDANATMERLASLNLNSLDSDTIKDLHLEVVRNINNGPAAIRSINNDEFDSKGRDWRDIPRGDNNILSREFINLLKISINDTNIFITSIGNLINAIGRMREETLDSNTCEKIIRSVAWVVQYEHESSLMTEDEVTKHNNDDSINADKIYNYLKEDDNFIKMIEFNPSSSFSIIDELLMAKGYRRVLIWFLTHLPLNQWLINYFHDLLVGLRGEVQDSQSRFKFSRVGPLILSEVEKSMLLHEFLSNAVIYLSRGSSYEFEDIIYNQLELEKSKDDNVSSYITSRSNAQKLIKMICLMLKSLEKHKILRPGDDEYRIEIQTLLVQWVGVGFVPEARELFFKYQKCEDIKDGEINDTNESQAENEDELIQNEIKNLRNNLPDEKLSSVLTRSKLHILLSNLTTFKKLDIFMILLNMSSFYTSRKDRCVNFISDLNVFNPQYDTREEIELACNALFLPLYIAIIEGDVQIIIEIGIASHLLDVEDIDNAREMITIYLNSLMDGKNNDMDFFREHFLTAMGGVEDLLGGVNEDGDTKKKKKKKKKKKGKK
ncbi:uncharacterized protein C5L36_0E05310 [Pichia kudriavzevii]|uniref:Uncharacterized protein n=1 Tax=Pichia kudriavzevii TaxID=4909 RepID=A0A2U9RAG9_PICKU|nr:uncharacterized protein C5L36_0E05310 [Pichia kudriavzevii]AWU78474.1 hypothetical protein C5L36_0E05310 [Pichia kudriavzevii]